MAYKPLVHDESTGQHRPLPDGAALEAASLPVSREQGNTIVVRDDGLFVRLLSLQQGNLVRYGNDLGLFLDANDLLSNEANNVLAVSPVDGKILLDRSELGLIVSEDSGNLIHAGTDGGSLLRSNDLLSADEKNSLTTGKDNLLFVQVVSPEEGNVLVADKNNGHSALLKPASLVSNDAGNKLSLGLDGLLVLQTASLVSADAENTLRDQNGLYVPPTKAVDLVAPNNELLFITPDGKVAASVDIQYDVQTGKFDLLGPAGDVVATVTIPSSVSALKGVTIEKDPQGQPAGTYMHFVFLLADGSLTSLYVNISTLIDVYTGGDGIAVSDNKISVMLATGGGLMLDLDKKLAVNLTEILSEDEDNALILGQDGKFYVAVPPEFQPEASYGISIIDGNKFAVRVLDHAGLTFDADGRLMVEMMDLVSEEAGNSLILDATNKLYVAAPALPLVVSADPKNAIIAGSDGGAYLNGTQVLSALDGNMLVPDVDGDLYLGAEYVISADADNLLVAGSDKKLFVKKFSVVSTDTGNLITAGTDGGAFLSVDTLIQPGQSQLLQKSSGGKLTLSAQHIVSTTAGNLLMVGSDYKLYVDPTSAIASIRPDDKILFLTGSNELGAEIALKYTEATGELVALGKNATAVSSVFIPSAASSLKDVTLEKDPVGQVAGVYIHFTFGLTSGATRDLYLNVTDLDDVYTGSNGIDVTGSVISLKLKAGGGLSATADGLSVDLSGITADLLVSPDAGNRLALKDGKLYVEPEGISTDAGNGLMLGTDGRAFMPIDYGTMD